MMGGQLLWALRSATLIFILVLAGAVCVLGTVSWLGDVHWSFELFSHFRFYYAILGLALALALLPFRRFALALLVGLVGAVNVAGAWAYIAPPIGQLEDVKVPIVRIVWANIGNWATDNAALKRFIERQKPDIVVLTELAASHEPMLAELRGQLPFQTTIPEGNPLGLLLLSKREPVSLHFDLGAGERQPLLIANLCPADNNCLTLLALHAARPFPYRDGARDRQLDYAASVAKRHVERGEKVVLVGDLNTTPFSPVFKRLLVNSGLRDSTTLPVPTPRSASSTWWLGDSGIGLQIDHALLSPNITPIIRRLGVPIGSDHLPLVIDIKLNP
jgi:endonuclease/exonuclease/phosphatase (EEP) superfamily protein YafD